MRPKAHRAPFRAQRLAAAVLVALGLGSGYAQAEDDLHVLPGIASTVLPPTIPQDEPPPVFPLTVPILSSRPTATAKLILDFDGDFTETWGSYHPGTTPAYSTDTDSTTYTQSELNNIHEIWLRVAEAYSPFNIDVTTADPGGLSDRVHMRVVVGGDGKNGGSNYWVGARAGGIGYVGGFADVNPNTAYVFPGNLANGTPKYTAMAISHEAGHGFGLQHQSEYNGFFKVQEYSDNDPTTTGDGAGHYSAQPSAPFMGVSYFATRGIWYYGPTTSSGSFQNDVDVIASADNAFGYYGDEAGGEAESATPMGQFGNALLAAGVITSVGDHDFYSFSTANEAYAAFTLAGAPYGGMLDASMALYDSNGSLLKLVATSSLGEFLDMVIPAGMYSLDVFSAGVVGDIGQYVLTGNVGPVPEPAAGLLLIGALPFFARRRRA